MLIFIYLLFQVYIALWLRRYFRPEGVRLKALGIIFLLLLLSFPAAQYARKMPEGPVSDFLVWFGFLWFGAAFIFYMAVFACDIVYLLLKLSGFKNLPKKPGGITALLLAALLTAFGLWKGAATPPLLHLDIPLKNLPAELDGFKIAQVSDLHLGRIIKEDRFRKIADRINGAGPDLVVYTGDFTDRGGAAGEKACAVIKTIKAKYGQAAVLGNHDMFRGRGNPSVEFFENCGVKLLRSDVYEPVKGLQAAGVDDLRRAGSETKLMGEILPKLDFKKPVIFLSHQPRGWEKILLSGSGLVLCGHTHKGQIFPFSVLEKPLLKYFYGLYREGDWSVYVTSGAGHWGPPMRLFADSEIPVFILRRAE